MARRPRSRSQLSLFLLASLSLAGRLASFPCDFTWFLLCLPLVSLLSMTSVILEQDPAMISFQCNCSFKSPICKYRHILKCWGRTSVCEFEGGMIQPVTSTKIVFNKFREIQLFNFIFNYSFLNQLCKQNGSVLKILNTETMDQCTEIEITFLIK